MSRPWPYNPQPSFPPLPTSPTGTGGASPSSVREALRSIAAELERGPRPETSPTDGQVARRRKLEAARAELVDSLSPKCDKCQDLEAEHAEASTKFFKEIEHLRRALGKMLDAATKYMPAPALRSLKESLQLDVRYLTRPEEGEGGPLPPAPVVEVVDYSDLIERLKKQIADQERDITSKKYTIKDLEEELRKLQEQLKAAGMVVSPTRSRPKRELPEHREVQTDPWMPFPPKQEAVHVVEQPKHVDTQPTVVKPKKEKKPAAVEQADSDSSDGPEVAQQVKKPKKVAKKEEVVVPVSTGIDPDVVRKLQAELELLKMKLAAAERELAKMDSLKAEIDRLKQLVGDKDKKIEELEEEIRRLKAKPKAAEKPKQDSKQVTKPQEATERKKEKRFKQDPGPAAKTPTKPGEKPVEVEEPPPEVSEDESLPPKTFEDKCVGTDPIFMDEPIKAKRNMSKPVATRYVVEQPSLEAEPYLTQVWETNPKGHRAPVKRELIKLGAISPQKGSFKLPEGWGLAGGLGGLGGNLSASMPTLKEGVVGSG